MSNKDKVVVIGGSGFLGSHLADGLSDYGYDVNVFDIITSPWLRPDQHMVTGDILDYKQVLAVVKDAKYVYHLAGVADLSQAAAHPRDTVHHNIIGSTNVIEACINQKVERFLFASTLYVYSDKGSFYRVSKQSVESILETYNEQFALEYTILRYGSLYGPRAQKWNGLKECVVQALKQGKITYPGTGEERREYIHVKDATDLSIKALLPEFANQCLTLTGTQVLSIAEVLHMIQEISGHHIEIEFSPQGSGYNLFHYSLTPYRYTPRRGKKMIPSKFIDLGQGILDMIEEVDLECNG